ncbi:hypothetical protein [Delftia sp. GW456-R20]|uniref:hypothetical protein n=1 Tax=Delftia sp. GW456-R20 TaxID=1827145 RepID=UPI000AF7BEC7|nr:hypothetical protein [Delftia sp. GW456-R20]
MNYKMVILFTPLVVLNISTAQSAPVVVQKGSTAQYIYIPSSSLETASPSGSNNGATSAKQFCKVFVTQDRTITAQPGSMLEDSYQIGAILIGGGSGGNISWEDRGYEGDSPPVYNYGSAGGGGSTAVLHNGALIAAAAGADAPTGPNATGNNGERVTSPEFKFSRNPPSVIRVVIGAGGASATPEPGSRNFSIGGLYSGWGGRGYYGGGSGALVSSSISLPGYSWGSPARGGSASMGGTGAVPLMGTPTYIGMAGSSMNGGAGSSNRRGASPSFGALKYGHFVYGGWISTDFEFVIDGAYGGYNYTAGVPVFNGNGSFAARVTNGVTGTNPPDENNMSGFGKGGSVLGNVSTTGTSGIVMLYYSAPICNVI